MPGWCVEPYMYKKQTIIDSYLNPFTSDSVQKKINQNIIKTNKRTKQPNRNLDQPCKLHSDT